MKDLSNYTKEEVIKYAKENNLKLKIKEEYHEEIKKNYVIEQSLKKNEEMKSKNLTVIISLGKTPLELYKQYQVNELRKVPILMYHGIINKLNEETKYLGGNVDKDGYNRTKEAFINDLEFYYQKGYRMIRLIDYIEGNISVELGKSPLILTFDDGQANNIKILEKDHEGKLIIDPNSAVGIMESFKNKYPDFNITATFFLNEGLFNQPEYNEDILKWLVDNGYDIGNHTKDHLNFKFSTIFEAEYNIAFMYQLFDKIIPHKYVNILSLPFGSPGSNTHFIFDKLLQGEHEGYQYKNISTLRECWEPELSPFHKNFDQTYLKRIRAWDNNGKECDLEITFQNLEKNRYISDGDPNTIVIPQEEAENLIETKKKVVKY